MALVLIDFHGCVGALARPAVVASMGVVPFKAPSGDSLSFQLLRMKILIFVSDDDDTMVSYFS